MKIEGKHELEQSKQKHNNKYDASARHGARIILSYMNSTKSAKHSLIVRLGGNSSVLSDP